MLPYMLFTANWPLEFCNKKIKKFQMEIDSLTGHSSRRPTTELVCTPENTLRKKVAGKLLLEREDCAESTALFLSLSYIGCSKLHRRFPPFSLHEEGCPSVLHIADWRPMPMCCVPL